jgi:hypothetical protein
MDFKNDVHMHEPGNMFFGCFGTPVLMVRLIRHRFEHRVMGYLSTASAKINNYYYQFAV